MPVMVQVNVMLSLSLSLGQNKFYTNLHFMQTEYVFLWTNISKVNITVIYYMPMVWETVKVCQLMLP